MNLAIAVKQQLDTIMSRESDDDNVTLNESLRLLSKWRSILIQNTLIANEGTVVLQGPLAGLDFVTQSAEGCHIAKLLGTYEQPLHSHLHKILLGHYTKVINIGCAEGYYAVGFARAVPKLISVAHDTDTNAQTICRQLAEKNDVSDRVEIGGLFSPSDFSKYENDDALVFCDIEGAEEDLLDPNTTPALRNLDIIVESHECLRKGITHKLISRFEATHTIEIVKDDGARKLDNLPAWFCELSHLDQLLATWEWRSGPTPWLVMNSREK
jgi:hypothetical protein